LPINKKVPQMQGCSGIGEVGLDAKYDIN